MLIGPAQLLRELVTVAIDEAGQSLGDLCTRLLRGEGGTGEIRAALTAVGELLDLLQAAERGG